MSSQTNAFAHYWRTLWSAIVTTIAGLSVTVKYLFSRPVTIEYPDTLPVIPDGWRGLHAFELDKCIRCRLCEQACPVGCIVIDLEGKGKTAEVLEYEINYKTCLFCNLCCEACPTDCLWATDEWDLACYRSQDCIIRFEARNPEEERRKMSPAMKARRAEEEKEKAAKKAKAKEKAKDKPKEAPAGEAPKPEGTAPTAADEPEKPAGETPKPSEEQSE